MKRRLMSILLVCFLVIMTSLFLGARSQVAVSNVMRTQAPVATPDILSKVLLCIFVSGTDILVAEGQAKCIQVQGVTNAGEHFRVTFVAKYTLKDGGPAFTSIDIFYEIMVKIDNGSKAVLTMILLTDSTLDGVPDKVVAERYLFDDKGQVLANEPVTVEPANAGEFFMKLLKAFKETFIKESSI